MGGELRPRRPLNTGVGEGLGSQVQGREQERGYLLEGAQFPGGPAPLLSEPQEKPGRAMLGGALEPQLSPPKTRKCQRLGTWGSEESVPWAAVGPYFPETGGKEAEGRALTDWWLLSWVYEELRAGP